MRINNIISISIIFVFILLTSFSCQTKMTDKIIDPCKEQKSSLVVDTDNHQLWMCQDNKKLKDFRVSIGRGGTYKKTQGDNKTPLGEYPLGTPRPSNQFGIFIPIGYPTEKQLSEGFSGSDIGLHGPSRPFKWLGFLNTLFDWTQGCIAVATDKEISEIAQWVKEENVSRIVIK